MLKNVNNLKISCNDIDIQIAAKAINNGAIVIKIGGLISVGIPVSKIPLRKISFDENL